MPKCRECGGELRNGNQCVYCGAYFEPGQDKEIKKNQIFNNSKGQDRLKEPIKNNIYKGRSLESWFAIGMDLMDPVEKYEYEKSFDSLILFRIGLPQELTNNCIAAIDCFDNVLKIDPTSAIAMMEKAWALTYLRNFSQAQKCCDDLIKLYPNDSFSWVLKGDTLRHGFVWGHDIQKAYLCYKKAVALNPHDENAAVGLDNTSRRRPLRNLIPIIGDYLP